MLNWKEEFQFRETFMMDLLSINCVDADMEDYGFEYSEEEQEEQDVDIENQYYNAKGTSDWNFLLFFCCSDELLDIWKSWWVFGILHAVVRY